MSIMISLTFSILFFFVSSINAFNITEILNEHPDFSTFNNQLTQTQLATTINARRTITVFVVDNGALSGVSGMSAEELKKVLSLHVALDYYDIPKLENMRVKYRILTTLFQASGQASGEQGFLNATKTQNGVVLGSAVPGSSLDSKLMGSVAAQPYNISVLQVSSVIVPPNFSNNSTAWPPSNSPTPTSATAPAPSSGSTNHVLPPQTGVPAPAPSSGPTNHVLPPQTGVPAAASSSGPTNHVLPPQTGVPAPAHAPSDSPVSNSPESNAQSKDAPSGAPDSVDSLLPPITALSSATACCNALGFGISAVVWSLVMGAF